MSGHIKRVIVIAAVCGAIGAGAHLAYGWNPFSKKDWEELGEKIKNVAEDAANWMKNVGEDLVKKLKQVKECAEVIPLGTEWAAKRAAYYVATATLNAAKTLQQADPILDGYRAQVAALQAKKASLQALKATANAGLTATQALAEATATVVTGISLVVTGAAAVKEFGGKASVADLKALKLPEFTLAVEIGGRLFKIDKLPVDLSSLQGITKSIIPAVKSMIASFSGGKVKKEDIDKTVSDRELLG